VRSSSYVVIELIAGKFQPEYAGNFYVALVDDMLRREHHNETIGILICGTKNDRSVRYSLGRSPSPMAVAAYTYDKLPPAERQALPNEATSSQHWNGPNPMQLLTLPNGETANDAGPTPPKRISLWTFLKCRGSLYVNNYRRLSWSQQSI
jgi:hypothetical protein